MTTHSPTHLTTHSRIGIDTVYLDVPVAGLPGSLEVPPALQGFFQTVNPRWKWALQHTRLANLWLGARDIVVDHKGRCMSGTLRVRLSVAELLSHMHGQKGNLAQASPARLFEVLSTLLEDLEDTLQVQGLAERAEISRLDIFADVQTPSAGQALAIFRDRMVAASKRAVRAGKSFAVGDNVDHVSFARRKGSGRSTEPTVVYDKGKQAGREDLAGLVRFEVVHGTGKHAVNPLRVQDACKGELWRTLLGGRLLELGLPRGAKIKAPSDLQAAILDLVRDGVPPAQAALYAAQTLDPAKVLASEKKLSRTLRDNRKAVEARTRIRFSSARPNPAFIASLWDLIDHAQLDNYPAGLNPYDDLVSESLGLRPRGPAYDASSLNDEIDRLNSIVLTSIHDDPPSLPDHTDDLPVPGHAGHDPEPVSVTRSARRPKSTTSSNTDSPTDCPVDLSFLDSLDVSGLEAEDPEPVIELQSDLALGRDSRTQAQAAQEPAHSALTDPEGREGVGRVEAAQANVPFGDSRVGVGALLGVKQGGRISSRMTIEGRTPSRSKSKPVSETPD